MLTFDELKARIGLYDAGKTTEALEGVTRHEAQIIVPSRPTPTQGPTFVVIQWPEDAQNDPLACPRSHEMLLAGIILPLVHPKRF